MDSTKTAIKKMLILILAVLVVKTALAIQPSLPTELYGAAAYANGTPAEGLVVSAVWTDSSGAKQTSNTKTLTLREAGDHPEYTGYYFFNQGRVQAQEGTEIQVEAAGAVNSQSVAAAPGKNSLSLPLLVLYDADDKTPPKISEVSALEKETEITISFRTNELTTSEMKYGKTTPESTISNNTFTTNHVMKLTAEPSTYLYEVTAKDTAGNAATDNNNGSYYSFVSWPQTEQTDKDITNAQPNPAQDSKLSILPTSIYGKLEDQYGNAVADAEVEAEWTSANGTLQKLKTETLNSTEAAELGNPDLKGYYFFRENITLPAGAKVRISSAKVLLANATANPGGSSKADIKIEMPKPKQNTEDLSKWLAIPALLIFLAIFLVIFTVLYVSKRETAYERFNRAVKKFLGKKAREIMSKKITIIRADSTLNDAAQLLEEKEKGGVVVAEGTTPIGLVNEKIITEGILIRGMRLSDEIGTDSLLKPVILSPDATLAEICMEFQYSGQKKAIMMSGEKMVGTVTIIDVAKQLREFCDAHKQELHGLPDITALTKKNLVTVKKSATLKEVRLAMSKSCTDCSIVDCIPEAIITERDIMKEIRTNIKKAKDTEASIIAESPIKTIPWASSISEANREMINAKFMRLPVTNQFGQASGIVRMEDVVSQLFLHLQNLSS